MEIKRDIYLNRLIKHKNNGMVKIITGVRRCGKSYLLSKMFRDHLLSSGVQEDHIIFLALDDYGNRKYHNPDELYAFVKSRITDTGDYPKSLRPFIARTQGGYDESPRKTPLKTTKNVHQTE